MLEGHVARLASRYEGDGPRAWAPAYPDSMLDAIACFSMAGQTVQSRYPLALNVCVFMPRGTKSKMSQNRPAADRRGVIETLEASGDADARAVAGIMRDNESRLE